VTIARPSLHPPALGATVHDSGTTFAVHSGGEAVVLCLYDEAGRETRIPLPERTHGIWHGHVPGVGHGQRYGFRVRGPWDPWHGHRYNPAKLLLDPYARAIDGDVVLHDALLGHDAGRDDTVLDERDSAGYVPRSVVVDDPYDWGDDRRPEIPWSQTVVYEAHVRGLTRTHPDVPEHLRGTYAGLAHPAVLEHLTSLGVTSVELLPVHQSVPELSLLRRGQTNYWGYNTLGFFAPHAAYAASGSGGSQVREFKDMVCALHAAGLEVLLDVVYNHTGEGGADGPTLSLRGLDNETYYRLRQGRHYVDHTGTGNTLDVRSPATLRMVTDSLRYWTEEMHVDGFRFDLAPVLARGSDAFESTGTFLSVVGQDPALARVKLVAEPWDVGPGGYQLGHFPSRWCEWNDRYRDAVREVWLGDNSRHQGSGLRDLAFRVSGSSDVFQDGSRRPLASVNFVTAHDGFTLHDLVTYQHKRNEPNGEGNRDGSDNNRGWNCGAEGPTDDVAVRALRRRMLRNLLATLLTSTGVPMITAGDEFGRTQLGNNNGYCLDDESTWADWSWLAAQRAGEPSWRADLHHWTRTLLRLRAEHPVLRQPDFFDGRPVHEDGRKDLAWFGPDGNEMNDSGWFDHGRRVLGLYLCEVEPPPGADGPRPSSLLVLLNTGTESADFLLPPAPWARAYRELLDTGDEVPLPAEASEPAGSVTRLDPCSLRVLAVDE
jgi:isoamylase